uniref:PA domain-containing protein n=1 Tax=Spongospora subterranea TaxID=70186 RepID=A0A0H5R5S1_9EUKA|eukprot:CRZ09132.1 hypothetical protein [Spongospora subterranea]
MIAKSSLILAALLLCGHGALAVYDTFLSVTQPEELRSVFGAGTGRMEHRVDPNSELRCGTSLKAKVIVLGKDEQQGCVPFSLPIDPTWRRWFVLLQSGGCSLSTKVENAQNAGVSVVIISNNDDELPDHVVLEDANSNYIHSTIIKKSDASKIFDYFGKGPGKSVEVTFEVGLEKSDTVSIVLQTSTFDRDTTKLLVKLGEAFGPLQSQKKMSIEHHYRLVNGSYYDCVTDSKHCGNQCTNSGRYCAQDPNDDLNSGASGADIVRETLRRICIHQHTNTTNPQFFWDYLAKFSDNCFASNNITKECSKDVSDKIDSTIFPRLKQCVDESGGTESESKSQNKLIEGEMKITSYHYLPPIKINGFYYYGSNECSFDDGAQTCPLLNQVCGSFTDSSLPDICRLSGGCGLGKGRDACGHCMEFSSPNFVKDVKDCYTGVNGVSIATVIVLISLCVVFMSGIAVVIHRRSTATMRDDLRSIMSQYVPLESESGGQTNFV